MAHSAVVIDQFVVVFGGLNKQTNNLISNDLYVLCLNGVSNALLPKTKALLEDKTKYMPVKKYSKQIKLAQRETSIGQSPFTSEDVTKPRAGSNTSQALVD